MIEIIEFDTVIFDEDGDTKIDVCVTAEIEGNYNPYRKKTTVEEVIIISVYRYDTKTFIDINSLDIDTRENLEIEAKQQA